MPTQMGHAPLEFQTQMETQLPVHPIQSLQACCFRQTLADGCQTARIPGTCHKPSRQCPIWNCTQHHSHVQHAFDRIPPPPTTAPRCTHTSGSPATGHTKHRSETTMALQQTPHTHRQHLYFIFDFLFCIWHDRQNCSLSPEAAAMARSASQPDDQIHDRIGSRTPILLADEACDIGRWPARASAISMSHGGFLRLRGHHIH